MIVDSYQLAIYQGLRLPTDRVDMHNTSYVSTAAV